MRIESLTFLRFFAAFVVVVYHHGKGTALADWARPLMVSGPQMVTFFFVLSGFVLMISQHGREGQPWRRFYLARLARIAPVYWFAIPFAYLANRWSQDISPGEVLLHASFLQSWVPAHVYKLNIPAWSVSVEAFFYLVFPVLAFGLRNVRVRSLLLMAAGLWALTQVGLTMALANGLYDRQDVLWRSAFQYLPINHLCSFVLGIAGGRAFVLRKSLEPKRGLLPLLACLVACAAIFWVLRYKWYIKSLVGMELPFAVSLMAPLFLALIWTLARSNNPLTRLLSLKPLVLLGEASYSLYILQNPVIYGFRRFVYPYLDSSKEAKFYVYLVGLVLISIASLYLIERPGRRVVLWAASFLPRLARPARSYGSGD